jgi:hypothetical protein
VKDDRHPGSRQPSLVGRIVQNIHNLIIPGAGYSFYRSYATLAGHCVQSHKCISGVRNLGNAQSEESAAVEPTSNPEASSMPVKIPWTISNKYYSADVHFAAHTVHGLSPHHLKNVPAVIFVWGQGEVCLFFGYASWKSFDRDAEDTSALPR